MPKAGPKAAVTAGPLDLSGLPEKRDYRRVVAFAEQFLVVPKGVGAREPFRLRRWQVDIARAFFPARGSRPRSGVISLPRANGKSGLAAVFALYGLFADDVEGAQVLCVASDERQARIVFNAARRMVELSPELAERVQVYADKIYVPETDSVLMPLPADEAALQGWDPTLAVVDELHVVNEATWNAMTLAGGKRPESLVLAISTPADSKESVMWQLRDYWHEHPDDKSFRYVEYAAPDGCELDDRAAWKAANPALGDFLAEDALAATLRTTREAPFRRYRLGQWVGSADSWLPFGLFETLAHPDGMTLPDPGVPVTLAFDGSASGDSTALMGCTLGGHLFCVGLWENPGDKRWRVPRNEITETIQGAFERWDVRELACDPWGWRSEMEQWAAAPWSSGRVLEWNTAAANRMGPATDRAYAAITDGTLTHDGDPDVARHFNNCVAKSTALGDLVSKDKRNSPRKIDAAVAGIVAVDRAAWHLMNPPKRRRVVAY